MQHLDAEEKLSISTIQGREAETRFYPYKSRWNNAFRLHEMCKFENYIGDEALVTINHSLILERDFPERKKIPRQRITLLIAHFELPAYQYL